MNQEFDKIVSEGQIKDCSGRELVIMSSGNCEICTFGVSRPSGVVMIDFPAKEISKIQRALAKIEEGFNWTAKLEAVTHICGHPDSQCDCSCMNAATDSYFERITKQDKEIKHLRAALAQCSSGLRQMADQLLESINDVE